MDADIIQKLLDKTQHTGLPERKEVFTKTNSILLRLSNCYRNKQALHEKYEIQINAIDADVVKIQNECTHEATTQQYGMDSNDRGTICDICRRQLR